MIFLDFEVFAYNWLVVFADTDKQETIVIHDDVEALRDFYKAHVNEIYVGYNIRNYDQFIYKSILAGNNPKELSDFIIQGHNSGYSFNGKWYEYPLIFFDAMPNDRKSLKTLEGFMGKNIKETDVDFNLDRPLTPAEIELTAQYCKADVQALMDVFLIRISEFESHMSLISTFNLPLSYLSKTQAQLSAEILECERVHYDDEWDITIVPTLRIKKYAYVIDWFKSVKSYDAELKTTIANVPHVFAFGGVHGAIPKYHGKGLYLHIDVNSFYPAIMIEYGLLSRAVKRPEKYREIRDKRIEYKKSKNPLQAPYKIVLNGTFGISKAKSSKAFDPRRANEVCINGQLLLLDLIEHLEYVDGLELIQSNTDGIIVKIPDTDKAFNEVDDICYEWESRTGMGVGGFDYILEIWQKDVNNYVFKDMEGNLERKGAYVKKNSLLDNDLAIINTSLVEYFVNHIPIETTINNCSDYTQFQKIYKVSEKFSGAKHNGQELDGKVFRVFASLNDTDTPLYKLKEKIKKDGIQYISEDKFGNCPNHCFIYNDDLSKANNLPLNKQWYIDLAQKRLNDFGC